MSDFSPDEIVVCEIAGDRAVLHVESSAHDTALSAEGFSRSGYEWVRPVADHAHRQQIVRFLMSTGALFLVGRDWSPRDIVELYKREPRERTLQCHFVAQPRDFEYYDIP